MLKFKSLLILAAAALGAMIFAPEHAAADMITYDFTRSNGAFSSLSPPAPSVFGTVEVDLTTSTTATITFTAASGWDFGGKDAMAVEVNATDWGISDEMVNSTSGSVSATAMTGAQLDNIGNFNQVVSVGDFGEKNEFSVGSFVLTDIGATWAVAADVLTPATMDDKNCPGGCVAGAHIQAPDGKTTGFVGAPAPPIGHGLPVLLAIGGMLFGAKLWERRKKSSFA